MGNAQTQKVSGTHTIQVEPHKHESSLSKDNRSTNQTPQKKRSKKQRRVRSNRVGARRSSRVRKHATRKRESLASRILSPISPKLKRKIFPSKPKTLADLMKNRLPSSHFVLYHTFNLLDTDHTGTISIDNLQEFLSKYTSEKLSYLEVRELFHRATDSYTITFDDFRRIMTLPEKDFRKTVHDTNVLQANMDYDPAIQEDVVRSLYNTSDSSSSEDDCSTDSSDDFPLRSPVQATNVSISIEYTNNLDRRSSVEARKKLYGVFNIKRHKSASAMQDKSPLGVKSLLQWIAEHNNAQEQSIKHTLLQPPKVLPVIKRYKSTDAQHRNILEEDFLELERAFQVLDHDQKGYLEGQDLARMMKQLGLSATRNEVTTLLKLAGKNSADERISLDDFIRLYASCCSYKKRRPRKRKVSIQHDSVAGARRANSPKHNLAQRRNMKKPRTIKLGMQGGSQWIPEQAVVDEVVPSSASPSPDNTPRFRGQLHMRDAWI